MSDEIKININAESDVPKALDDVSDSATRTSRVVVSQMGSTGEALDDASKGTGKLGDAFDALTGTSSKLAGGMDSLAGTFDAVKNLQQAGAQRASELKRKEIDVEQAFQDTAQAAQDLEQATIDLNQATLDGKQAAQDLEQAEIDKAQAMVDAEDAQKEYNQAVKEHGANSTEARQASVDLRQAQADLKQANLDAEQAQQDQNQAQADGTQAAMDMTQATIDAESATQDYADAQREAQPTNAFQQFGQQMQDITPIIMGVVGAMDLLTLANGALSASMIKQTAANIASKAAMIASSVAAGIAAAAQVVWNFAVMAFPVFLIIAAIAAIVAGIIWLATKTTFFQDLWKAVWSHVKEWAVAAWRWIKDAAGNVADYLINLPRRIGNAFMTLGNALFAPFKWAFNAISWGWNNTIGRLRWTIPNWVPQFGGSSISAPRLPSLAHGGEIMREGLAWVHKGERLQPAGTRGMWDSTEANGTGSDAKSGAAPTGAPWNGNATLELMLIPSPGSDEQLLRAILKLLAIKVRSTGGSLDNVIASTSTGGI